MNPMPWGLDTLRRMLVWGGDQTWERKQRGEWQYRPPRRVRGSPGLALHTWAPSDRPQLSRQMLRAYAALIKPESPDETHVSTHESLTGDSNTVRLQNQLPGSIGEVAKAREGGRQLSKNIQPSPQ